MSVPTAPAPRRTARIWDRPVRLLHAALAIGVMLAWVSSQRWTRWHEPVGLAVGGIVALRLTWGFVGRGHARFARFVRSPRTTWRYARSLLGRREPRHLGHNPLGGWMVVLLLACTAGAAFTGWLYTTDTFWGDETVERVHTTLAWTLLALVVLHLAGVLFTSLRHRENLVAAMLDGRKRPAGPGDVG